MTALVITSPVWKCNNKQHKRCLDAAAELQPPPRWRPDVLATITARVRRVFSRMELFSRRHEQSNCVVLLHASHGFSSLWLSADSCVRRPHRLLCAALSFYGSSPGRCRQVFCERCFNFFLRRRIQYFLGARQRRSLRLRFWCG